MRKNRQRQQGNKDWETVDSQLVQRLESLVDADAIAVEGIARALGPLTAGFSESPAEQLPVQLRLALPTAITRLADPKQMAKFIYGRLEAIGVKGRGLNPVIRLRGRELQLLFPSEVDLKVGTYLFRQARLLLEECLNASPNDTDALACLSELSLLAHGENAGIALAR